MYVLHAQLVRLQYGLLIISLAILATMTLGIPATAFGTEPDHTPNLEIMADLDLAELMQLEVTTASIASRYAQKTSQAPASITVVTAGQIQRHGYRTLGDILRSAPGYYVSYDRNYSYVGVRGYAAPGDYGTRVLIMINGQRLNDSVYGQASVGTEMPLDVDLIDRVEIMRGPGSSIYGASALLGVVNIITKSGRDLNGTEVAGSYGSFDAGKARLTHGRELGHHGQLLMSGTWEESDGDGHLFYRAAEDPDTTWVAEDIDDDHAHRLFAAGQWGDVTVQGIYGHRKKNVPTATYETIFNDSRYETVDEYTLLDLKYEHEFADDLQLVARAGFNRYLYEGDYPYAAEDGAGGTYSYLNRDEVEGRRWSGEVQLIKPFFERHLVTVGGEVQYSDKMDQKNFDKAPYYYPYLDDDSHKSTVWAFYLQDELRLLDSLTLTAGLRYDHYDTFGSTTNPRLAMIYVPTDTVTCKLLYGQAFRAPNAYELYYGDNLFQSANTNLDPETMKSWELSVEQSIGKFLRYSLAAFHIEIDDLIAQGPDPANPDLSQFNNTGGVTSKGLEVQVEGTWPGGAQASASYTYAHVKDDDTGYKPANSPRHLAKANLHVPLLGERLQAGVELLYTSARVTVYGTETDDFWVTNLTLLSHHLLEGLDLSLSVYNLFDTTYSDPASLDHLQDSIEQDGRTFRLAATYKF